MSEVINVRGPSYFRELEERERVRRSIKIIEKQMEEQIEKKVPDAIDKLASGLFRGQKIDIEIKI